MRELREEFGFTFSQYESLGWNYVDDCRPGQRMYIFLARDVTPAEKQGGDLEEDIESLLTPLGKLKEMVAGGEITNFSVLAAWPLLVKVLAD